MKVDSPRESRARAAIALAVAIMLVLTLAQIGSAGAQNEALTESQPAAEASAADVPTDAAVPQANGFRWTRLSKTGRPGAMVDPGPVVRCNYPKILRERFRVTVSSRYRAKRQRVQVRTRLARFDGTRFVYSGRWTKWKKMQSKHRGRVWLPPQTFHRDARGSYTVEVKVRWRRTRTHRPIQTFATAHYLVTSPNYFWFRQSAFFNWCQHGLT